MAAATLSDRYIADRFLPDKAIDLVDESAAKLKMEMTSKPAAVDRLDRKVCQRLMQSDVSEGGVRPGLSASDADREECGYVAGMGGGDMARVDLQH